MIELKLASAMTAPHRPRDFDDVIQLIRVNGLPKDYAVDAYVGAAYRAMWKNAQVEEDR